MKNYHVLPKQFRLTLPKLVSIIAALYFIYYLWWRVAFTFNPNHPFISWLLWVAEAFGVFAYLLFAYITKNIEPAVPFIPPEKGIGVDVFIPTYNESEEILEATLVGCNKIRYPHTTYILDDGNRRWVKSLALRLGVLYLARPSHDHAKAGNINYALQQTHGQFIVVLDADMVPQPDYLERTLGYFRDEKLALVQLPQEFYNKDSIQHANDGSNWHEQSLFFRVIQPGKNYTNSAFWCGSPSVIRRAALEEIGGVATETITEDIHTTVRLHSKGWKTLFINEALAFGIAPQTIKSFLVQRLRWAQGTMQLYSSKESPLWIPGLTFKQRWSYFSSFLAYLEAYQKLILLLLPISILGFDIFPMRIGLESFLIHWTPFFLLNYFANQIGGRGFFNYFKTEKYNLLKTIIFIESTLTLFVKKPLQFKVTPKSLDDSVYRDERKSLSFYIVIFALLVVAMVYSIVRLLTVHQQLMAADAFAIAFFWAGYNSTIIMMALLEVFRKRHERNQYRFPVKAVGVIFPADAPDAARPVKLVDLSVNGCGFLVDEKLAVSENLQMKVYPRKSVELDLPVARVAFQRRQESGKVLVGATFAEISGEAREALYEFLFITLPPRETAEVYSVPVWHPLRGVKYFFIRVKTFITG